jgi:hypothetical protein
VHVLRICVADILAADCAICFSAWCIAQECVCLQPQCVNATGLGPLHTQRTQNHGPMGNTHLHRGNPVSTPGTTTSAFTNPVQAADKQSGRYSRKTDPAYTVYGPVSVCHGLACGHARCMSWSAAHLCQRPRTRGDPIARRARCI